MEETAWVKLWHPQGIEVRLPLPADGVVETDTWKFAIKSIDNALAAGWLASAPGLVAGEDKLVVGVLARRIQNNQDGSETDVLDLYPESDVLTYASVSVYLNKPEDVAAFEQASGMQLASLQTYVGSGKIQRGKSKHTDALLHKPPQRLVAIVKPNPRYDPAETEVKRPKLLFDRWEAAGLGSGQPAATPVAAVKPLSSPLDTLRTWLMLPDAKLLDKFNACAVADFRKLPAEHPDRKLMWTLISAHAEKHGWVFDKGALLFTFKARTMTEMEIPF